LYNLPWKQIFDLCARTISLGVLSCFAFCIRYSLPRKIFISMSVIVCEIFKIKIFKNKGQFLKVYERRGFTFSMLLISLQLYHFTLISFFQLT
jgi:hypothetical protein